MYTLILSIACAAGAGCDYEDYKVAEFHDGSYASSMCSSLSNKLMASRTQSDKEREALFRCLDNNDPKNKGRELYIPDAPETTLFVELCPYNERTGRFKKQGSPECTAEDVATFYGELGPKICANRVREIRPVLAFDYNSSAFDGHLNCITMEPGSDAL